MRRKGFGGGGLEVGRGLLACPMLWSKHHSAIGARSTSFQAAWRACCAIGLWEGHLPVRLTAPPHLARRHTRRFQQQLKDGGNRSAAQCAGSASGAAPSAR